ncbi:unnamed protein product [Cercospora beticola]|nr:unnamed protein product [Cercospora beticola]
MRQTQIGADDEAGFSHDDADREGQSPQVNSHQATQSQPAVSQKHAATGRCRFCEFFQNLETLELEQQIPSLIAESETTAQQAEVLSKEAKEEIQEAYSGENEEEINVGIVQPQSLSDISSEGKEYPSAHE